MASPFSIFRKHQKAFLAVLALLAMIAFVFLSGPVFDSLTSSAVRNPVVVSTKSYGNLTEADLANLIRQQTMVLTFFERIYRTMGLMLPVEPPSEEAVVETWILANRARELGVVISNQTINAYLQEMTGGKIPRETFRQILRELHLSDRQLFEALRMRLAAQQMLEIIQFSVLPTTPAQRWDYYQRLNRRATVELVAEPVAKYVDRIAEPDEATLKEFFEKYKENYYDPSLPQPGFRRPHRVVVEYLKADIAQFIEPASITKEQIQQYYEKNKEVHYLRSKLPPVEKTLPKQSAPAEPGKPAEEKTPSSPPEKPSAKPTEPASPKSPEEKAAQEKQSPSGDAKPSSAPKPEEKLPTDKPPAEKPSAEKPPAEKSSAEKTPPEKPPLEKPGPEKSKSVGPEPSPAEKSGSEKSGGEKAPKEKPASSPPAAKGTSGAADQEKIRFFFVGLSGESEAEGDGDSGLWNTSAESEQPAPKPSASPESGEKGSASSGAKEAVRGEKGEKSASADSEASKGEVPAASSQPGTKGPESKPTPPGKQGPSESPGAAEAAKPGEKPSGASVPATPETSKYLSLEEVEGEIREVLARGQAQAKIEQMLQKIRDQMNVYSQSRLAAVSRGNEPPPPPNLEALAKQYGLQYRKTPLAAEWQFRRDYRDLAQAQIAGRESVIQFLYYQGRPLLQAALAQDVDSYYLFWKLEDAKEAIPSWDYSEAERLEKEAEKAAQQGKDQEAAALRQQAQRARKDTEQVRQEVLRAWKMDQARSLARNRAAQLAELARKTGRSLQEALAKEPGVTVLESGPFSWLTHGTISPRLFMQAPPPRISDVPHVEAAGEEFMEAVFRLQPGETAVAFNRPQTVAYVVRVKSFEPSQEVLWKMFLAEPYADYSSVAVFDQQKIRSAWMEELKRSIGFRWERTAHPGGER